MHQLKIEDTISWLDMLKLFMKKMSLTNLLKLVIVTSFLMIGGCANNEEEKNIVDDFTGDEIILGIKNVDLQFQNGVGVDMYHFEFEMVTSTTIQESNIKIKGVDESLYSVEVIEIDKGSLPEYVYYTYLGIDWKKLYNLELASNKDDQNETKLITYLDKFSKGYGDMQNQDIAPNSHYYLIALNFRNTIENVNFDTLEIVKDDFRKDIKIGNVSFSTSKQNDEFRESNGFELITLASNGMAIIPNKDGYIITEDISFRVNEDVELISVKEINHEELPTKVQVSTNGGDGAKNVILDANPIRLKQGAQGYLKATIKDENFMNTLDYARVIYLEIIVKNKNGDLTSNVYTALVQTRPSYQELVVRERDKLDFSKYYNDYYSKLLMGS